MRQNIVRLEGIPKIKRRAVENKTNVNAARKRENSNKRGHVITPDAKIVKNETDSRAVAGIKSSVVKVLAQAVDDFPPQLRSLVRVQARQRFHPPFACLVLLGTGGERGTVGAAPLCAP
jgi:hypothetical protein